MKKIIIFFVCAIILFFAFFRSDDLNLEGDWSGKQIVFEGKDVYKSAPAVKINTWNDSMYILDPMKPIRVYLKIKKERQKPFALLSSDEELLNGRFDLEIDTLQSPLSNPHGYRVNLKLRSEKAYLHLIKEVYPQVPRKVELPRKGAV